MSKNHSWITTNFSQGEMTLEIPAPSEGLDFLPQDWFQYLDEKLKPSNKSDGQLFLTRKGWEENKEAIRTAYFSAIHNGFYQGDLFHNKSWLEGEIVIYPHEETLLWEELEWHINCQLVKVEQHLATKSSE